MKLILSLSLMLFLSLGIGISQSPNNTFFVSSNTSSEIGVFGILDDNAIESSTFMSAGVDADGIFYDKDLDVLYQLNRTDNVINAYSNVSAAIMNGGSPDLTATSTSDFANGREIAFSNGKIIVAQDANDSNGGNQFFIYSASSTSITLDKVLDADINLWGISVNGNTLYAVEDNSSNIAVYENFFGLEGAIVPTLKVSIEGLVRTHGIVYVPDSDMMLLTDVGDADLDNDGAIIRIKKFTTVSQDGMVTSSEQIRASGGASLLGNPVDIAYDKDSKRVYVAERKRDGGLILCFKLPAATGGIAPAFSEAFPGASAIYLPGLETNSCAGINGGKVSFVDGGTEKTIFIDGVADMLSFSSSMASEGLSFTYVVTDSEGKILGIPPGNTVDFDPAGLGTCIVYGVAYKGNLNIIVGDDFLEAGLQISDVCFDVSDNSLTVNRIEVEQSDIQFYASSNTSGQVGVFSILGDGETVMSSFASEGIDADGIYYDENSDVLYQLNRTDNVINAYGDLRSTLAGGNTPMVTATSTSDFMNGREIAFSNGKIVVAQDANDTNGGNQFYIYNASGTSITLDKILDAGINLWGIHLSGNTLFAIEDNSNNVSTYENFFDNAAGPVTATSSTSVDGLVRTHGLTYVADADMMFLTDIGDADSGTDGAIIRIKKYSSASSDGIITAAEQIRVSGGASFLGNPVDIAYNQASKTVYVAERKRDGGLILGFKLPAATGGIAPIYRKALAGASAINFPGTGENFCDRVDGGMVSLSNGGTETTIIIDGLPDLLSFNSNITPSGFKFTYVITDADGMILGIPPGNINDFDPAGLGVCRVYGLSYIGSLNIEKGDNFLENGLQISGVCFDVSDNFISVNRIETGSSDLQFFSSSNTSGEIGVFSILDDNQIARSSFMSRAGDADGIYYDENTDVLYQLNRTDNVIDMYGAVKESLNSGMTPTYITSSDSDFSNGREIAVVDNKLIVAQDASETNDGNKLIVYDITATTITLSKMHPVDINLWGIFVTGNTLFAIEDNSSNVAIFSNFFNKTNGPLPATRKVEIADMIRTHGLLYDFHDDMLVLTDIGDPNAEKDGAIVVIRNFSVVSADGIVSADEQARATGGAAQLGNPVDITLDKPNKRVYIAERKKNGGMILGFKLPKLTGGIAPAYQVIVPGASAIHLPGLEVGICEIADGGMVELASGGTETTIFIDGKPDMISFLSTVPEETIGFNFTYVITDSNGKILGIPPGNTENFENAGTGICYVYGLSYLGTLKIKAGDNIINSESEVSTGCSDFSDNRLTINRITPEPATAQMFASSNTAGQIGVFNILGSGAVVSSFIDIMAADAEGIHYDESADVLYQLNRTDNVINAYSDVNASLSAGNVPMITATSTSDFNGGSEITKMGNKIIVSSGIEFYVYNASPNEIIFEKIIFTDILLSGIVAEGTTMYAVDISSGNVAIYEDFLNTLAGTVSPTNSVIIDKLIRTQGIAYDAANDMMFITDAGNAADDEDGAIVAIEQWTQASLSGFIPEQQQLRIEGDTTLLGNPVDVAYDNYGGRIYVAERLNNGGRILGFDMIDAINGEYKPSYIYNFEGASAVHISGSMPVLKPAEQASERSITAVVNNLYPSPASDKVNLSIESLENISTQVQVFDMTGRMVQSQNVSLTKGENLIQISVLNLSSGFHYISIQAIGYSEKFLKIK